MAAKSPSFAERVARWTQVGRDGRRNPRDVLPHDAARKMDFLRENEMFAPLSSDEQAWLMHNTTMVTCEKGRVFHSPGDPGEVLFIVKRGKVDLYRLTTEGRKLVITTLGEKTMFGEMGLIGQHMHGCFAEAAEESLLCILSRSDMQALVRRNPEVGLLLLAEMGRRLDARETELEALAFHDLPLRLAGFLVREADADGLVRGYTHQAIADRLGTYRETVSEILGRFRAEGLITTEARQIKIVDAAGLKLRAEPA
jgi:CRP/FNR family transcriptional regulator, cyclic AMP receptor protein